MNAVSVLFYDDRERKQLGIVIEELAHQMRPFKPVGVSMTIVEKYLEPDTIVVTMGNIPHQKYRVRMSSLMERSLYPEDWPGLIGVRAGRFFARIKKEREDHLILGEN